MKSGKKKLWIILTVVALLAIAFAIAWNRWMVVHEPFRDTVHYPMQLDTIRALRRKLAGEKPATAALKALFIKSMSQRIFPYWYGTKWDFSGTTQKPQEGSIACGYFVTTTLQHAGVKLNRVKLACCASEEMIRALTAPKNIHHLSGISLAVFEQKMQRLGHGLYIIGLDNHTGYVLMSEQGNYFIHASGWFPFKVVRTKLSDADVIGRSKYRVVGKISDDENFLRRWIAAK